MNQSLGNFLLVVGVVLGTLAAADSKRAYRTLALEPGAAHPGQFLYGELAVAPTPTEPVGESANGAPPLPNAVEVLAANAPLDAAAVERLLAAGVSEVRVRYPAITEESIAVGDAALGRVLARPVTLSNEQEEVNAGRRVDDALRQRADAAGVTLATDVVKAGDADPGDSAAVEPIERLTAAVELPVRLRADEYIDAEVLARLQAAGISEIAVRIAAPFDREAWKGWRHRYTFIVAIVLMLLGVCFKRMRPSGAAAEEQHEALAAWLAHFDALERGVRELVARADELDAQELHQRLDPLLLGPALAFLEGRETLRAAHGVKAYTRVMGPYAGAERKLHRAWSAAADGVVGEARSSLSDSIPYLEDTRAALPAGAREL